MPVNPELTERVFAKTSPYLVGREKVREFARAVFATDPVSFNVEAARSAGHADLVAPPTFAVVVQQLTLDQLFADGDAGFVVEDVVHGEQRFISTRPIVAGDELTARLRVTSIKSLGGNAMLTAETEIQDAAGEPVVTAVATLVVRADA
ncbi:MaoC family dehydratase N-terminal domain-containing protein [Herbiconiux sp.]|uniref:FAS1-like dehydratase domain-containing protein n=1 Tax=Herbiconiux sp. TaxID=1871186 RepID=UPI0025BC7D4A|nr:MaoC family dehydratase N-terminal domain-containing protein [Herbiconiux sp.]